MISNIVLVLLLLLLLSKQGFMARLHIKVLACSGHVQSSSHVQLGKTVLLAKNTIWCYLRLNG